MRKQCQTEVSVTIIRVSFCLRDHRLLRRRQEIESRPLISTNTPSFKTPESRTELWESIPTLSFPRRCWTSINEPLVSEKCTEVNTASPRLNLPSFDQILEILEYSITFFPSEKNHSMVVMHSEILSHYSSCIELHYGRSQFDPLLTAFSANRGRRISIFFQARYSSLDFRIGIMCSFSLIFRPFQNRQALLLEDANLGKV